MKYYPEGTNQENLAKFTSLDQIKRAIDSREVFESKVIMCDKEHNLHIDLGVIGGIIPRNEGAIGILEGTVRDIALISKVNRRVCFRIMGLQRDEYGTMFAVLSRRNVQLSCMREYIDTLQIGDVIPAKVTHLENFGAFIDIGAGINSLIPIDMLSVSRISHSNERLKEGQQIYVALKNRDKNKLTFTLKELLGTWQENVNEFTVGETVTGIVRSVEDYGVFVELMPNLAGLAEPCDDLKVGSSVSVFIKSIIPDKMKIKLVIVDKFDDVAEPKKLKYYNETDHIDTWQYSPDDATKCIYTDF